jgi:hypothetical protein
MSASPEPGAGGSLSARERAAASELGAASAGASQPASQPAWAPRGTRATFALDLLQSVAPRGDDDGAPDGEESPSSARLRSISAPPALRKVDFTAGGGGESRQAAAAARLSIRPPRSPLPPRPQAPTPTARPPRAALAPSPSPAGWGRPSREEGLRSPSPPLRRRDGAASSGGSSSAEEDDEDTVRGASTVAAPGSAGGDFEPPPLLLHAFRVAPVRPPPRPVPVASAAQTQTSPSHAWRSFQAPQQSQSRAPPSPPAASRQVMPPMPMPMPPALPPSPPPAARPSPPLYVDRPPYGTQQLHPATRELCVRLNADGSAVVFDGEEADAEAAANGSASGPFTTASMGDALFEMRIRGAGVTVTSLRYNPRVAAAAQLAASAGAPAAALLRAAQVIAPRTAPSWFAAASGDAAPSPPLMSPQGYAAAATAAANAAAAAAAAASAAASPSDTPQRRTARVRALFDDALGAQAAAQGGPPPLHLPPAALPSYYASLAGVAGGALDLSSAAVLRQLGEGRLGDALAAATSPTPGAMASSRPKPRALPA